MRIDRSCWGVCLVIVVALTATVVNAANVNVLQVETDGSTSTGYQYTAVDFAGNPTTVENDVTYHALSGSTNTKSTHADSVRDRLLAADGTNNPVKDIYCLFSGIPDTIDGYSDFLNDYVKTASPSPNAFRPNSVGNNIKIVNSSWINTYQDTTDDTDAIRRIDYMIQREDLVMLNGAVSPHSSYPTIPMPLVWASRNGIAVRGIQPLDYTHASGIGKTHADLWGPKTAAGRDEESSYETPGVAGYAAALIDVAAANGWSNGTNGLRHEVVKSILMTGADKTDAAFTDNGFSAWTSNGVNNLDNADGAGRADYNASLAVLNGGLQTMASVSGTTINSPIPATETAAWTFESSLSAYGKRALIVDLTNKELTQLTATLAWDVTQREKPGGLLDTTSGGVLSTNLDLELLPVAFDGGAYTLGSSLGIAGLRSLSTDDNLEHLYVTNTDPLYIPPTPGLYAFVISNNSNVDWTYGYGFSYAYDFTVVPEPGTLCLLIAAVGLFCCLRRLRWSST